MQSATTTVTVAGGIHARIALELARVATEHASTMFLMRPRTTSLADAMAVLALGIASGDEVVVVADGRDEREALAAALALLHG